MKATRITALFVLAALLAAPALADSLITKKSSQEAFMGKPASEETSTVWVGKDRMAMAGGATSVIVRADQKKLYIINTAGKTYSELDLPIDLAKYFPAEMQAQIAAMIPQLKLTAKVTPTEETKKIGAWNAKLYKVELTSAATTVNMDVWATKDVALDFTALRGLESAVQGLGSFGAEEMAKEMGRIEGIEVLKEMTIAVMGNTLKRREEIVSVETKAAPAGTYEVPAGLTKEAYNPMKAAQGGGGM